MPILKLFQTIEKKGTLPNPSYGLPQYQNQVRIYKGGGGGREGRGKENYRPISLMNIFKNSQQTISRSNSTTHQNDHSP
jgi:hypothetical protein